MGRTTPSFMAEVKTDTLKRLEVETSPESKIRVHFFRNATSAGETTWCGSRCAEPCLRTANPAVLALASRMRFDASRRVGLTSSFFVSLAEIPISRENQQLVAGFFSAYQPLSHAESLQLEREMSKVMPAMAREKAIRLTNPFIELGIHRGRQEGRQEGAAGRGARTGLEAAQTPVGVPDGCAGRSGAHAYAPTHRSARRGAARVQFPRRSRWLAEGALQIGGVGRHAL